MLFEGFIRTYLLSQPDTTQQMTLPGAENLGLQYKVLVCQIGVPRTLSCLHRSPSLADGLRIGSGLFCCFLALRFFVSLTARFTGRGTFVTSCLPMLLITASWTLMPAWDTLVKALSVFISSGLSVSWSCSCQALPSPVV